VDVSQSKENEQLFRRMGGGNSMPLTFVGDARVDGYDRTKLTHALAQAYGLEYLDWAQREAVQTHFNADGTPKVVMYATDWCPYCTKAREYFTQEGIPFTEVDVEKSAEGERHYKALQASGYPLIYVGVQRIAGFDRKAIKQEVDAL
jgi:glutaredoxin